MRKKWRERIVLGVFIIIFIGIFWRLFDIQVIHKEKYKKLKRQQITRNKDVLIFRGRILASGGEILAISDTGFSVFAEPKLIDDPYQVSQKISSIFNIPSKYIFDKISQKEKGFVWIKRKITLQELQKFQDTGKIKGVDIIKESERFYPYNELACHLIGFTGIDDQGLDGLEYILNEYLSPNTIRHKVVYDARGVSFSPLPLSAILDNNYDIYLTIDLQTQKIVEEELERIMEKYNPDFCLSVAMEPGSGKILAMAVRPAFAPDRYNQYKPDDRRNRVVTDAFEPGSIFKPIMLSIALSYGVVTPKTTFLCENGVWKIDGRIIKDTKRYQELSVTKIISYSSNIGATKIGLLIPKEIFYNFLVSFGFGEKTGIGLPGETNGKITQLDNWNFYTHTSVPWGYEILVSPLQLVSAFSAIANDGKLMRPYVIEKITDNNGRIVLENRPIIIRRVLFKNVCEQLREILVDVVENGTGTKAKIKGIKVAGKTGTAKILDQQTKRYTNKYISSFVGFAPAEKPRICALVVVYNPKNQFYGGTVSAPAVREIIKGYLNLYGG